MPDFLQLVSMMREQMNATLSRSDVLKPLAWLVGIISLATVLALFAKPSHDWVISALVITLMASVALYGGAFAFCLFTDRDALRSEKYSLQKLAIEHGIYGDSREGVIEIGAAGQSLPAPTATSPVEGPR